MVLSSLIKMNSSLLIIGKYIEMEEYRRQLMLVTPHAPASISVCLNQMWYNLLVANDQNISNVWCNHMSDSCKRDIQNYFSDQNINLKLN